MDELLACDMNDATPIPVTLKELSVIAVALEIWRCEVNKYSTKSELEKFSPIKSPTTLKAILLELPSVLHNMVEECVTKIGLSMKTWLKEHYTRVFFFHYAHQNHVLDDFDDFVCDHDGAIQYARTAEHAMRCDRFGETLKFEIACTYFFEDYVRQVWPSVRHKLYWKKANFSVCPQIYYWICSLGNELNMIPYQEFSSVDEVMLDVSMPHNRPSVEYFWHLIPVQKQTQKAMGLYKRDIKCFAEYVLPKLDDRQLDEFVNKQNSNLMFELFKNHYINERLIFQIWKRLRNVLKEDYFEKLVIQILSFESDPPHLLMQHNLKNFILLCSKIWNSAPHKLRRSVVKNVLPNLELFQPYHVRNSKTSSAFLMTILSYATFKERNSFWHHCWSNLILGKSGKDLQRIMEMCFENSDKMIWYKENMAKCEEVQSLCLNLLRLGCLEELKDFVDLCWTNTDAAQHFKQQLLQSTFLGEYCALKALYFCKVKEFHKFISDAFGNADLATDFKNHLMSSPATQSFLVNSTTAVGAQLERIIDFIETFVPNEQIMQQIKTRIIDHFKNCAGTDSFEYVFICDNPLFHQFLLWCLGSDEEVMIFRAMYVRPPCSNFFQVMREHHLKFSY